MAVEKDATLGAVVERLVSEGVHRVYVVDGKGRPEGVVTLTGVCSACDGPYPCGNSFFPPVLCRRVGDPGCVMRVVRLWSSNS